MNQMLNDVSPMCPYVICIYLRQITNDRHRILLIFQCGCGMRMGTPQ